MGNPPRISPALSRPTRPMGILRPAIRGENKPAPKPPSGGSNVTKAEPMAVKPKPPAPSFDQWSESMGRKLPKPPREMPMGLPTGKRPVSESPKKSVKPTEVVQGKIIDLNMPIPGVSYFEWTHLSLEEKLDMYKQHEYKQFDKEMAAKKMNIEILAKDVLEQIHRVKALPYKENKFDPYKKCEEVCCTIITSPFDTTYWPYCSYDCKEWDEKIKQGQK